MGLPYRVGQVGKLETTSGPYIDTLGAAITGYRTAADAVTASDLVDGQAVVLTIYSGTTGAPTANFLMWSATWDNGNSRWTRVAELDAGGTISDEDDVSVYVSGVAYLSLFDTDISHNLLMVAGSNLTADRTLTITTGDANRALTLSGDATLSGSNTGDQAASEFKLDDLGSPDDNTDLNASTTAHGLAPKATAPASGSVNVLAIANGETVRSDKTLLTGCSAIVVLSDAAYAALSPPDADTFYWTTG